MATGLPKSGLILAHNYDKRKKIMFDSLGLDQDDQ